MSSALLHEIRRAASQALLSCDAVVPVDAMDVVTMIQADDGTLKQAYAVDSAAEKFIQMLAASTTHTLVSLRSMFTTACIGVMLEMHPPLREDRDMLIDHLGNCFLTSLAAQLRVDSSASPPRYQFHLYNHESTLPPNEQTTLNLEMIVSLMAYNCASQCVSTLQYHNHWRDILLSSSSSRAPTSDNGGKLSHQPTTAGNTEGNMDASPTMITATTTATTTATSLPAKRKITTAMIIAICTVCGLIIVVVIILCCQKRAPTKNNNTIGMTPRSW